MVETVTQRLYHIKLGCGKCNKIPCFRTRVVLIFQENMKLRCGKWKKILCFRM